MNTYKFRAECELDVKNFMALMPTSTILRIDPIDEDMELPDVECILQTSMTIDRVRFIAFNAEDCHVIAQTIAPINEYTGERDFNIRKQ